MSRYSLRQFSAPWFLTYNHQMKEHLLLILLLLQPQQPYT